MLNFYKWKIKFFIANILYRFKKHKRGDDFIYEQDED